MIHLFIFSWRGEFAHLNGVKQLPCVCVNYISYNFKLPHLCPMFVPISSLARCSDHVNSIFLIQAAFERCSGSRMVARQRVINVRICGQPMHHMGCSVRCACNSFLCFSTRGADHLMITTTNTDDTLVFQKSKLILKTDIGVQHLAQSQESHDFQNTGDWNKHFLFILNLT